MDSLAPGPGASRTAELATPMRAPGPIASGVAARDVTSAPPSPSRSARPSPPRSERLNDDRLGAELATAEAHPLFVEGAPLQGGGRAPQPEASLQRA